MSYDKIESTIHALLLLNLLNTLRKSDNMLGKPRILSLFPNSFNKLNKHEQSCKLLYLSNFVFLFFKRLSRGADIAKLELEVISSSFIRDK